MTPTPTLAPAVAQAVQQTGAAIGDFLFYSVVFGFVMSVIFAAACGALARRQGRSVAGAILAGFFFGMFALVVYSIVGEAMR